MIDLKIFFLRHQPEHEPMIYIHDDALLKKMLVLQCQNFMKCLQKFHYIKQVGKDIFT